ncbi:unnamed protein product [Paramecium primaurelia]|uniref:WD40-repeat-containing domain n=1 Tax=Paramecium primaurelia TaxID=5886 RepID=A0A8S1M9N5_PARPR|nr:unnamed protein product [Paramecium primaurelia]
MANTKQNMRPLRPNFNIKNTSQVSEQEPPQPTLENKEQKAPEPKINLRPFVRPPSSKKDDVQQSQQFQESIMDQKVDEQKNTQQRRTPVNGFRKFNLQSAAPIQQNEEILNAAQQYQGPAINLFANKEKIQQEVSQIKQKELRQMVQVQMKQRPLNAPEMNLFSGKESVDGSDTFKKMKPIKPTNKQEPITKDTIKVAELLENKIQFQAPQEDQQIETKKIPRTRVKQAVQEQIDIEQLNNNQQQNTKQQGEETKMDKTQKEMNKTISKKTGKSNYISQQSQQLNEQPEETNKQFVQTKEVMQNPQQTVTTIDDYKERTIQFNTSTTKNVFQGKTEEQKKRVKELQQLITLEVDDYSNQLVIQPRTEYETYLNHIKANIIRNSCDQAFDDRLTVDTQTDEFQTNDFGGQCPEDYNRTFLAHKQQYQKDNRLCEFIEQACDIFEEILNIDNNRNEIKFDQEQLNHKFPNKINNVFKTKCLNIVAHQINNNQLELFETYYIENDKFKWLNGSLIIQYPQNVLYYTPSKVTCLICEQNLLICGNADGQLCGWSINDIGYNNKYIDKIKELLQNEFKVKSINFASEWNLSILDQFSDANMNQLSQIQQITHNSLIKLIFEIVVMDVFGNIQVWEIQDLKYNEQEKLYVDLGIKSKKKLVLLNTINKNLTKIYSCMSMDIDTILICGPSKVINISQQRSYYDDSDMQPCTISNIYYDYFCVGYSDGHIKLFHKDFTKSIWQLRIGLKKIIWIRILSDGLIGIIDSEQNIFVYFVQDNTQMIGKQLNDKDHWRYNYAYQNGQELTIVGKDKNNDLQLIKERLELKGTKSEIFDNIYLDYYGQ